MGYLAVTDKVAVKPDIKTGINAFKVQIGSFCNAVFFLVIKF